MKKSISFLLILAMILSMLCIVPAVADGDEQKSGSFHYFIQDDGTAIITQYDFSSHDITIPETIDGHVVTAIGESAFAYDRINNDGHCFEMNVRLPDSITSIGNFAFQGDKIIAINIPDSVQQIGYGVFWLGPAGEDFYDKDGIHGGTLNIIALLTKAVTPLQQVYNRHRR